MKIVGNVCQLFQRRMDRCVHTGMMFSEASLGG